MKEVLKPNSYATLVEEKAKKRGTLGFDHPSQTYQELFLDSETSLENPQHAFEKGMHWDGPEDDSNENIKNAQLIQNTSRNKLEYFRNTYNQKIINVNLLPTLEDKIRLIENKKDAVIAQQEIIKNELKVINTSKPKGLKKFFNFKNVNNLFLEKKNILEKESSSILNILSNLEIEKLSLFEKINEIKSFKDTIEYKEFKVLEEKQRKNERVFLRNEGSLDQLN